MRKLFSAVAATVALGAVAAIGHPARAPDLRRNRTQSAVGGTGRACFVQVLKRFPDGVREPFWMHFSGLARLAPAKLTI